MAKKAALCQGMAGNLKDLLLSYDWHHNWPSYIRLLQCLDSKLRQREPEKKKETTNTPSTATPSSSATPSPTAHVTSNPAYLGPAPMDLSAAHKQAEQECIYLERRSGGLCSYCGLAGDFRAACPRRKCCPLAVAEATLTPRAEGASTSAKDWSHAARLAPPWDDPHLSHLSFVVRSRKKDWWKEGSNCQELRCQLQRNRSLIETTS